tara:strand:+ start:904 stop:1302 length:399 start_codon:yes stop_codon:yes gene_type:complete
MKYKDSENQLYVDPILANHDGLVLISDKEFNKQLAINNAPVPLTSEQIRNNALSAIDSYDFKDGRVIQIRIKEDRDNLKGGIKKGQTVWKMKDNKVYSVTTADLQSALDDQESQIAAIWATHFADLERGVLI